LILFVYARPTFYREHIGKTSGELVELWINANPGDPVGVDPVAG